MPEPEEVIRATNRVRGLLQTLHNVVHSLEHHGDLSDFHTMHEILRQNGLLELVNGEADGGFEGYKDLAEFLFLQVYMQAISIATLTNSSVCDMMEWQLDNLDEYIGRMN